MVIFDFTDYRIYLRAYYEEQKAKSPNFSYRYFSEQAGIGGKNYFQMVMDGHRNLSVKTIPKFIKALKLKKKEAEYFEILVFYTQAKKQDEKNHFFERLTKIIPHRGATEIEKDRYLYFTNKYLVILREMVSLPHFKEDPEWLSQSLEKAMTPAQIIKAIDLLLRLNLLARDKKKRLVLSDGTVTTTDDVESIEVDKYYHSLFSYTKDAILNVPYDKRAMASLTIPVPEKLLPQVKELIQKNIEEIVNLINNAEKDFDEVYQYNAMFFPVTKTKEEK